MRDAQYANGDQGFSTDDVEGGARGSQEVIVDQGRCAGDTTELPPLAVSTNLPDVPAITDAELDAIERYMGDILDLVLGGASDMPSTSCRLKPMS